jgi:hypothetical protein
VGTADPPARAQGGVSRPTGETALQDNVGNSVGGIVGSIVGSIVGTWRLVMTRARNDAGEPMHAPYGPQPMGVVVFSADGRMIAVLCDARPLLPDGFQGAVCAHPLAHSSNAGPVSAPTVASAVPPLTSGRRVRLFMLSPCVGQNLSAPLREGQSTPPLKITRIRHVPAAAL